MTNFFIITAIGILFIPAWKISRCWGDQLAEWVERKMIPAEDDK